MVIIRLVTTIYAALWVLACTSDPSNGGAGPGASDGDALADGAADVTDASEGTDAPAGEDLDQDLVADVVDNCPGLFNPDQADDDGDGLGNVCDPENDDRDRDGIPNLADPFPDDALRPKVVRTNTVYAHTATELYLFGVKGQLEVELVGAFDFSADTTDRRMTDIAVDRYGVMWGIGFQDVFVVDPTTAEAWRMAALPQEFNGLTLIPKDALGATADALVGIDTSGGWWRLELVHAGGVARIQTTNLGRYGSDWSSSGDAFSIEGVGTFASVQRGLSDDDQLVAVDPATGLVTSVVAPLGFAQVWGLAGWAGRVYAFDASGEVVVLDLTNGAVLARKSTGKAWWGAGVRTVLDE